MYRSRPGFLIFFSIAAALLSQAGCSDEDCGCCDLPAATRDWLIEITLGPIPDDIVAYPVFVDVWVKVRSLENGDPATDGLILTMTVSPGAFVGGGTTVERPLQRGGASATIRAEGPGSYRLTASMEGDARTVSTTFSIGG